MNFSRITRYCFCVPLAWFCAEFDAEEACDYLEKAVDCILTHDAEQSANGTRDALRGFKTDNDGTQSVIEMPHRTLADISIEQYEREYYDPLRGHPRFIAAIARLKNAQTDA